MIHQGSAGFQGSPTDIEIQAKEVLALRQRMAEIIAQHTGQPLEKVEEDIDRDRFMTAEEAQANTASSTSVITTRKLVGGWSSGREARRRRQTRRPSEHGGGQVRARRRSSRSGGRWRRFGESDLLKCSFCGKSQKQVKKLIAGPGVYICDECIDLCNEIIEEELSETQEFKLERAPQAPRDLRLPERLRDRPGAGEEGPVGRRLQPLQADPGRRRRGRRGRAAEVEHHAARAHRVRQDAPRADARPHAERPVRHRRRHGADRGRLRRRGRREHPAEADPGRRLRREEGRDRDHLHRRGRQDRPQEREPVDHP